MILNMYFIAKTTGEIYVEAHYVVPMEFQNQFEKSWDIEANINS